MHLAVHQLTFAYRHRVLFDGLTFGVRAGEILLLSGANGTGKSTLLAILAGLLMQQKGSVDYADDVIPEYLPAEANGLFERLDGADNLRFWQALKGRDVPSKDALKFWGLDHSYLLMKFPVEKYSTGMKRRLALTRLTMSTAKVWLLDEPVYGLDAQAVELFRGALREHCQDGGCAVMVSHDLSAFDGLPVQHLRLGA